MILDIIFPLASGEDSRLVRRNVLRDRELSQVVANHLGLDLNLVELLAGVDTNHAANHLGDDDHVSEVGLDEVGLLIGLGLLLSLAELLDQTHGLALETAVDSSAGTGVDDIAELVGGEVEESVSGKSSQFSIILFINDCGVRSRCGRSRRLGFWW